MSSHTAFTNQYTMLEAYDQDAKRRKQSTYQTACKICLRGVYAHESRIWLATPMGISHTACAAGKGLADREEEKECISSAAPAGKPAVSKKHRS